MSGRMTRAAAFSAAVCATMLAGTAVEARRIPQDLAGKLSGTWVLNRSLSTGLDVGGSPVKVKSTWDKRVLKQEFSNNQAKVVETWGLDEADRLVLTAKVESLNLVTPDRKAVFDRR